MVNVRSHEKLETSKQRKNVNCNPPFSLLFILPPFFKGRLTLLVLFALLFFFSPFPSTSDLFGK